MYRTSSAAAPACPACQAPLHALGASPMPAHVCPTCGGTWLGPEASVQVMRGLGDAPTTQLAKTTTEIARRASVAPPASGAVGRGCPVCAHPLAPLMVASIQVDSCPAHGTWFDRHEVAQIAAACRKLQDRVEDEERHGAPITFEGVLEGTATVGYGITKAAVNLVVGLFAAIARHEERQREEDCIRHGHSHR